jgi:hypothetical protein
MDSLATPRLTDLQIPATAMANFFTDNIETSPRSTSVGCISDLAMLEPIFRAKVQKIIQQAAAHGVAYMVFETYRSKERQKQLFTEGASKLKDVGVHHYGLACDIVRSVNGNPSWKGDFSLLGKLAAAEGLIWGGDWGAPNKPHTFIDPYHIQRCALKDQPALFRGEWYPPDDYVAYKP